jgi:hypothetical protein
VLICIIFSLFQKESDHLANLPLIILYFVRLRKSFTTSSSAIMPVATDWKCCDCHHTWSYANHVACLICHHRRCGRCTPFSITPGPKPKPRQSQNATTTRSQPNSSHKAPSSSLKTSLYTCCRCHDGPKVWEHQRRCVNCNHTACSSCRWAK